ncbi:MAG: Rpn family recombination-promoting nuclease/putative transposase [Prevotellaceae bacterium]|jgi:predicted transposase/invertase (TIGR01784 family)|nr:Rpn family recombination-promoting nuclease/putative transposase [Prevotellaceae bacterium]
MQNRTLLSFDWAVKRLLRNKANYVILEGFLSELLRRAIKINRLLDSESNRDHPFDKFNRVDILAESEDGEMMIIEVQFTSEYDYFHRMLYGAGKLITQFINKGDDYAHVRKVYSINIVYFDLGKGDDYVYHGSTTFHGMHTGDELQLTPMQRREFGMTRAGDLFPEYYILEVKHFNDVAKDTLDEWIYYLKNNKIEDSFKAQGLEQARAQFDYDRLSDDEKQAYDRSLDSRRGERVAFYTARIEGREEGLAEGEVLGMEKGMEKGRAEGLRHVVLNAHRTGMPLPDICALTGLPKDTVEAIIQAD